MPVYTTPNFRNAPTAYLRANNLLQKSPIYYCVFGLVTGPGGVNSQVLPNQYATAPILNATQTRKRWMTPPRSFASQINPVTFQGTLGQMQFDLQDNNGEITNMVASYTMKNRYVTIYRGFDTISESDYTPIFTGQIQNWQLSPDATVYTFTVVDPLKMATAAILNGHTQLVSDFKVADVKDGTVTWHYTGSTPAPPWQPSTAYVAGASVSNQGATFQCLVAGTSGTTGGPSLPQTLTVSSVYGFAAATDMNDGKGPRNFLKVDNNLFSYTGLSGGSIADGSVVWTFTGAYGAAGSGGSTAWKANTAYSVGALVSNNKMIYACQTSGTSSPSGGPAGTGVAGAQTFTGVRCVTVNNNGEALASTHNAGSTVENYVLYEGNPVDLLLQVLMSTGTGTNYSGTGVNYDVLPAGQGIGVPYSAINVSNIEKQRNQYVSDMVFSGYFLKQVQGLKFIQDHILPQALCFLYTNVNGQVDVNFPYPAGALDAITLDQTNIVGEPGFDAHLASGGYFYNDVDISYDYQPVPDYYANENIQLDGVSLTKYREDSKLPINAQLVNSYHAGLAVVLRMQSLYLKFFSSPPPVITCKTFDAIHLLNPGALVYINHPNIPNYKTGKRGGSILCLCIAASPDYYGGAMNVTLLGIGFYDQKKYARWSPTSSLNGGQFPVFTAATDQQKRYGFWGNKVGTYAQMSDGSDGYYWGP